MKFNFKQYNNARYTIRQSGMSLNKFHTIIKNQHDDDSLCYAWLESRWPNNSEVVHYAEQYLARYDYLTPMIERKLKEKQLEETA